MSSAGTDGIAWLKGRLGERIEAVPVQGDRPLLLDDPSCAYITLSEHHQLFCVGYRAGQAHGRREHLAVCGAGQLIFGLEPPPGEHSTALILSGVTGSVVWRVPMAALLQLAQQPEGRRVIATLFDSWISLLIAALPQAPLPSRARSLSPGEMVDDGAELPLHSAGGIVWVAPPKPPLSYGAIALDSVAARADAWPLSEQAWALGDAGGFRVWNTEQLLEASGNAAFAAGFSAFVAAVVSQRRAELGAARLAQDAASRASERKRIGKAFQNLAAVGSGKRLESLPVTGDDAFERACNRIFNWLELDPAPRVGSPRGSGLSHMQAALSRITGIRTRGVLLEGAYWKDDCGPLLAFITDDGQERGGDDASVQPSGGDAEQLHPVALLPAKGGYECYDPRSDSSFPIRDQAAAERLHPQAHQIYRGFPPEPMNPLDVLRFSARGTRSDVIRIFAVGMAAGLLGTLLPLLTGQVFDRIIPGAERGLLWQLMSVLLAVYAGSLLFDVARGFTLVRAQTRMDATLEAGVWDRLLNLPLPFYRTYSAGDLAARAAGIASIREVLSQVGLSTMLSGMFSIWNFALLFYFDVRLALAATTLVMIAGIVAAAATYYELGLQRTLVELDGRIAGLLLQLLGGIAKLRVSGSENLAFGVWARMFALRRDTDLAGQRIQVRVSVFHAIYPLMCSIVLFYLVAGGGGQSMSTGQFLAFSSAFGIFMSSVLDIIGAALQTLSLVPLYERAKPILQHPVESQGHPDVKVDLKGGLELSHISFRYEKEGPLILDDVTLRIEPGEFVAVVGPSGSGKSTLLRIMLGFELPTEGGVFYDGQALTSMDLRAVRQQIGVVLQHSKVMAGDIYTNIVGNSGMSLEDAWRAARAAAFGKDVEEMPMGMHTVLSQEGGTLSGGQRQRLLIARALAAQPRIMFFDEATSALDNRTQAEVSESLEALRVTRVVIAHRLSTIRHADRIVVVDRGRIVQMGRFDELIEEEGAFAALARRQMT